MLLAKLSTVGLPSSGTVAAPLHNERVTSTLAQFKSAGFLMIAVGLLTAVVITLRPEALKAPAWLAYLAALAFVLAGCISLARAYQRPRLADGIVCLLLAAFAAIELWIAFGPGARHCMGRVAILGFRTSELSCRGVFAIGALIVGAMLFVAARSLVRQRSAA